MSVKKTIKRNVIKKALKQKSVRKKITRGLLRRALRPIPIIGTGVVLLFAAGTLRRKGAIKGSADVALDLIPIIGTTKTVVEVFTGDLIPDKEKA
jgi:hypothetical protein